MMFVCGRHKECATKRLAGQYPISLHHLGCRPTLHRLREAVECLKHALIPADPHEITINLKLAKLHRALEEPAEAIAYHRRVVEVCQADR